MKTLALALGFALAASAQTPVHIKIADGLVARRIDNCKIVNYTGSTHDMKVETYQKDRPCTIEVEQELIPPVRYEAPQTVFSQTGTVAADGSCQPIGAWCTEPKPAPPICTLLLCAQYADGIWYVPKPEQAAYCTEIGRVRRLGYHDWRCGADHRWRRVK